jgi:hypothetical protein
MRQFVSEVDGIRLMRGESELNQDDSNAAEIP